ncbi:MAG: metallophosphoesterase [Burkholderiaceae bacterium]|nr:metallophosphoesterase [Rhodoferax sp.]MCP5283585.1 metallophosphoesterase [Burkholderiaceae bacterium]
MPDVVVVTGDLTQRATAPQFDAAWRFLGSLPAGQLLVQPGNHDIPLWAWWERLRRPYGRFQRHFGTDRCPVVDRAWVRVVAADSVAPRRHAGGHLSPREVARVAAALDEAQPGPLRIVALHHPLDGPSAELFGAQAACRRWAAAGARIVLSGHAHRASARWLTGGTHHAGLWAVTGGTAISRRTRGDEPPSVNLIGPLPDGDAWLQRWAFDAAGDAFTLRASTRLPCRGHDRRGGGCLSEAADTTTARQPMPAGGPAA